MTEQREKLFSVTIKDCETQVFRAGGNGGQGQNTTDSGVRVIHHPSGARAECRETRSQHENRRRAFAKMARSAKFQGWVAVQTGRIKSDEQIRREVEAEMQREQDFKVEVGDGKHWKVLEEA